MDSTALQQGRTVILKCSTFWFLVTRVTKGNSQSPCLDPQLSVIMGDPPKNSPSFVLSMMVPYYEKKKSDEIHVDLSNSPTLAFLGVLKLESSHRRSFQRLRETSLGIGPRKQASL